MRPRCDWLNLSSPDALWTAAWEKGPVDAKLCVPGPSTGRTPCWARFHERSDLCDPGSLLTQDRSTHRVKIVSTNVGSVRVKRPLGSILVLLVVRGPGNPNKEIASFPIGIFRNPLTGDPRVSASETALGSRTKDEYSSMNEDVSNPTLFGGSSGEYMDSLGSVYNSRGHCSCPHTSSQTTLGHPVLQQLLGDSAAAFEHRAQLLQQESALSH